MNRYLSALLFILLSLYAVASAPAYSVSGSVADSGNGKAIEMATVAIRPTGKEEIAKAVNTAEDGSFTLNDIKEGKYEVIINVVGYAQKTLAVEVNSNIKLGNILLSVNAKTLQTAEVVADKNLIVKTSEKTVFNVAQSPSNQTGTAEDVLRNMPGVQVDQKGNVTISGKQGVKILVDGKPNALAQNDLPSFLKSIPAGSIEAIELITNPSAKYDAEGNAGIINIRLKKGAANGFNAKLTAGYGILNHYYGSADFNYRKNKINVFGNYSINATKFNMQWIEHRTILLNDTTTHYNMNSQGYMANISNNLKTGFDYFINDKNTFTYSLGGNYSLFNWHSVDASGNLDSLENPIATYNSTNNEKHQSYSIANDLSWTHRFDTTGHELMGSATYTYVSAGANSRLNSLGYDSTGAFNAANSLQLHNISATGIHNFIFQLDYTYPFKKLKGYKFDGGLKNEFTNNLSSFNANTVVNNTDQPDALLSNNFNYVENIAAAYGILSGQWKKLLSYSAGLRAEHTYIKSNNNAVDKDYFSLFPSGSVNLNISDIQALSASYSRRVQRPQFRQLNNQVSYIDQYTTWQGDPYLVPAFSHLVSLNYTISPKKFMFSLQADGTFQTNGFTESSYVDSNHITRGGAANGSISKIFNLTFFARLPLAKWVELSMNHTYAYTYYGFIQGQNTGPVAGSSYNLWADINFKCWKNMEINVGGWFNSRGVNPQGAMGALGGLHASVKKSFLNNRLTVAVSGQNLLQSIKWSWTVNTGSLMSNGSWQEFDRMVMISLSYRFGSNNPAPAHREKEKNERLEGGGGRG